MKNAVLRTLFIMLSLTLLIRCCTFKRAKTVVQIDMEAFKYVTEFKGELLANGIDVSVISDSINMITFYPLDPNLYGMYIPINKQIVINGRYALDTIILKKVLYHELGHLYGIPHSEVGIMQTNLSPEQIHKKYCPTEGGSNINWEMHKAYFFSKIKKVQDSLRLKR